MMTWVSVSIGCAGLLVSIITGIVSYQKGLQKESTEEGQSIGTMLTDIKYIKNGIDDIRARQDKADTRHIELVERITRCETRISIIENNRRT